MSTTSRLLNVSLAPLDWTPLGLRQRVPGAVRIEEIIDGPNYELRAEAPGLDPAKDITVVYHDGALRMEIRRTDVRESKAHTEFHYGTYGRTVSLPDGVDEDSITASYRDGILEITAKIDEPTQSYRTIPVTTEALKPVMRGKH
ncbi:MAG TPA: Hsp20/alpha crystallin family protein [Micromonosporaceae bacterium]|nr:Hsp20/alpha crystallin family protein [Micromonosporaceae bacterium]